MRLTSTEVNAIKHCIEIIDNQAEVYLFGSRTDDQKKGGDIDLLIISNKINFDEKLQLKICIKDKIGDQKIDLLTSQGKQTPFARTALEKAIKNIFHSVLEKTPLQFNCVTPINQYGKKYPI